jgi:hypothetical protein
VWTIAQVMECVEKLALTSNASVQRIGVVQTAFNKAFVLVSVRFKAFARMVSVYAQVDSLDSIVQLLFALTQLPATTA